MIGLYVELFRFLKLGFSVFERLKVYLLFFFVVFLEWKNGRIEFGIFIEIIRVFFLLYVYLW